MFLSNIVSPLIRLLVLSLFLWVEGTDGSKLTNVNNAATTTTASPTPTPSTLIDILSSEVQFSSFLTLIQKHGLVPVVNSLQNVTLLAPVNLAFTEKNPLDDRDNLLRYIIDQKFRVGFMKKEPIVVNTLYNIHNQSYQLYISPNFETYEYEIDKKASIVEYDIYAKHQWSFIQAIDSQITIKPIMCEILLNDDPIFNGVDISFVKGLFKLLFEPSFEAEKKKKKKHDKYKIIPYNCELFLQDVGTFLIPSNDMVSQSMSTMTQRYYSALYHVIANKNFTTTDEAIIEIKYDITKLLTKLFLNATIAPGNTTTEPLFSVDKEVEYDISGYDDSISLNDIVQSIPGGTILAADGTLFIFDVLENQNVSFFNDLSIGIVDMIPRKSLFALHYSDFVSELSFRSLDYLIDGTTTNKTILLDKDQKDDISDDIALYKKAEIIENPVTAFSFSNKQRLLYQVLDEAVNITKEMTSKSGVYLLQNTLLCSTRNINGCYKLKMSSSLDDNQKLVSRINDEINIISEPIDLGSGVISYMVDKEIAVPDSFKHTLSDLLSSGGISRHLEHIQINQGECLKTLQYLKSFDLLSLKHNKRGYSAFLPCGMPSYVDESKDGEGSWERLGLILNHLEKNPDKFKKILKGIFIEDQIYSDFGLNGNEREIISRTLQGESLTIRSGNFTNNYNRILTVNDTAFSIPLNSDLLFDQGVIHVVDKLLIPNSFQVSLADLIKSTEDDAEIISFMDLLENYPKFKELLSLDSIDALNYSILVPSQDSLFTYNITKDLPDLSELLGVHLIPNSELPKLFDCMENKFNSKNPGDTDLNMNIINSFSNNTSFICRQNSKGKMILDINNREGEPTGHKIKILNYGCTSMKDTNHSKPCVFMIDKPIQLKWLRNDDGFLHIHLGYLSIAVGIILGLVVFSILIFMLIFCLSGREEKSSNPFKPYEESGYMHIGASTEENPFDGGYETDDDMLNERVHLLPSNDSTKRYRATSNDDGDKGVTKPVSIKGAQNKALNRFRDLPDV